MKIIKKLKYSLLLGALFFAGTVPAFEVGGPRHYCKTPQFRDYSPPKRIRNQPFVEVAPESEIAIKVMGSVDPETIRVFAKKIVLEPTIVNKSNFYQITATLPAKLRSGFVRIDLIAKADKGECTGKDGWLIKIKEVVEVVEPVVSAEQVIKTDTTEKPTVLNQ